jgi:hypothetical protein
MLHIVTALYRPKLLKKIYKSLPDKQDITWHIGVSIEAEKNLKYIPSDIRAHLYIINCEDKESWTKRQACLERISDGYYCFLDDDTTFHDEMYEQYKILRSSDYKGMAIGEQLKKDGTRRLRATTPKFCQIDIGNVICHHSANNHVKFPSVLNSRPSARDYEYWRDVYEFYNNEALLINKPISVYNNLT